RVAALLARRRRLVAGAAGALARCQRLSAGGPHGRHPTRRLPARFVGPLVARPRPLSHGAAAQEPLAHARPASGQSTATPPGAGLALAGGRRFPGQARTVVHRRAARRFARVVVAGLPATGAGRLLVVALGIWLGATAPAATV